MGVLDSFLFGMCESISGRTRDKIREAKDDKLKEEIGKAAETYPKVTKEDLNISRSKRIKATYLLDLSTHNEMFEEEAEKAGMSTEEYKKYCKRCISEYDEIFRIYNLTHIETAEY